MIQNEMLGVKKVYLTKRHDKCVDSLFPHSPMHQAQFFAFFFSSQGKKWKKNWLQSGKKQNKNKKKWAKNTIKKINK